MAAPTARRIRQPKSSVACSDCRLRKVKCNGGQPCPNCLDHSRACIYRLPSRRGTNTARGELRFIQERLDRDNAHFHRTRTAPHAVPAGDSSADSPASAARRFTLSSPCRPSDDWRANSPAVQWQEIEMTEPISFPEVPIHSQPRPEPFQTATTTSRMALTNQPDLLVDVPAPAFLFQTTTPLVDDDDDMGFSPPEEEISYEYYGYGSFMALCSNLGIEWVVAQIDVPEFAQLAKRFTANLSKGLTMDRKFCDQREPDPDQESAWHFCRAYFEEVNDSIFGVVCRTNFENRLRMHYGQGCPWKNKEDPAWYALRNAVFATGSRQVLSTENTPRTFAEASTQSWKYLQNALSVYTELLLVKSGLMAVQALIVLMHYSEGVGAPAIDFMVCSNAMRLAESKGLHRQPPSRWKLSEEDIQSRRNIWWAIYCYEVHIGSRYDRPLAINLDNITCELPSKSVLGSTAKLDIVTPSIRQAQLTAQTCKRLADLRSQKSDTSTVLSTITDLDRLVREWRGTLPDYVNPDTPLEAHELPLGIKPHDVGYPTYVYHRSLIQIHSVLFYPWSFHQFGLDNDLQPELRLQKMRSTNIVLEHSRKMIKLLGFVSLTPATPKWKAIFSPLMALISLFVYVLQYPTHPSIEEDIVVMQIAAGHFNHYGYVTGDRTFAFASDLVTLARLRTVRAREKRHGLHLAQPWTNGPDISVASTENAVSASPGSHSRLVEPSQNLNIPNSMDLSPEMLSSVLTFSDSDFWLEPGILGVGRL